MALEGYRPVRKARRCGLALAEASVVLHPFAGGDETLAKAADRAVRRDDKKKTTRYGLRLALSALGLKTAAGIAYPWKPERYPRFVMEK